MGADSTFNQEKGLFAVNISIKTEDGFSCKELGDCWNIVASKYFGGRNHISENEKYLDTMRVANSSGWLCFKRKKTVCGKDGKIMGKILLEASHN
ncbi:hypothetical protein NC652_030672 [Populus alba x Populus x berolinensis]|nr:hypothetical protein NC652_030672 [Populus alba x Populus x berolinensis]